MLHWPKSQRPTYLLQATPILVSEHDAIILEGPLVHHRRLQIRQRGLVQGTLAVSLNIALRILALDILLGLKVDFNSGRACII